LAFVGFKTFNFMTRPCKTSKNSGVKGVLSTSIFRSDNSLSIFKELGNWAAQGEDNYSGLLIFLIFVFADDVMLELLVLWMSVTSSSYRWFKILDVFNDDCNIFLGFISKGILFFTERKLVGDC